MKTVMHLVSWVLAGALSVGVAFGQGAPITPPAGNNTLVSPSTGPNAATLQSWMTSAPPIEAFAAGLVCDGVTDDSVAVKAAHDAAFAAGVRYVYVGRQCNAPNAWNLGNVIFMGPGALLGTYQKRVIPIDAPSPPLNVNYVVPSLHLRHIAASTTGNYVVYGDSTCTVLPGSLVSTGGDGVSSAETLWRYFQEAMARGNPGVTLSPTNFCVGGQTWTNMNGAASSNWPAFYANHVAAWVNYVENSSTNISLIPDLIDFDAGTNDGGSFDSTQLTGLVAKVLAWPKIPDLIFTTNLQRSNMSDVGAGVKAFQETRDYPAMWIRSYALYNGYGLIDGNRASEIARDGFDVLDQSMVKVPAASIPSGAQATPYTVPVSNIYDYEVSFTVDNTSGLAFGASGGPNLRFQLSSNANNYAFIQARGGAGSETFGVGFTQAPSVQTISNVTTQTIIRGVNTILVAVKGTRLHVEANGAVLYDGPVIRFGGQFTPTIAWSANPTNSAVTMLTALYGVLNLVRPRALDCELYGGCFGDTSFAAYGGNGINHPGSGISKFYSELYGPGSLNLSLAAAGVLKKYTSGTPTLLQPAILPATCVAGTQAFAWNGRNVGESAGAGTGVIVTCNSANVWMANGAAVTN